MMAVDVVQKTPMTGKTVKFAITTKERLENSNKIFQKVEIYIDNESGYLYIVPEEDLITEFQFKIQN